MKIKSLFILIIFTQSFIYGQVGIKQQSIEKQIIGIWNAFSIPELKMDVEFTADGYYNYYYNDILETNLMIDDILYHQLTYEIVKEKNQTRLLIYGKQPKNLVENYLIEFHNGTMHLVRFKMMKGITHHIDEYYTRTNSSNEHLNDVIKNTVNKTKIIFPKDFKGLALIAFEEKKGLPSQKDNDNLEILSIPKNGLLRTQAKPKPLTFAKEEVVYFVEKENGTLEEIKMIYGMSFTSKGLDKNKLYALNYGFNQIDRPRVNSKLFKSEVKNDVLFLAIGTPDELSQVWNQTIQAIQE